MRQLLTMVCFDLDALNGPLVADLIAGGLGFEPQQISTPKSWGLRDSYCVQRHLPQIARRDNVDGLRLRVDLLGHGSYFRVATTPGLFQAIYWRTPVAAPAPALAQIERLTLAPGFNVAYASDADDVAWQSERSISNLEKVFGRSHQHLSKIHPPDARDPQVDIYANPGARYPFPGGWLHAGWRMWIGPRMQRHLPRQRLLRFKQAHQIRVLKRSGTVFIQLYDDPTTVESPEARRRQHAFRQWVDLVQLAHNRQAAQRPSAGPARTPHEPGTLARRAIRGLWNVATGAWL